MVRKYQDLYAGQSRDLSGRVANKISQSFPAADFKYFSGDGWYCYPMGSEWSDINFPLAAKAELADNQMLALIYLSDDASFRRHFSGLFSGFKNRKFNEEVASQLNHFLGSQLSVEDFEEIWFAVGLTENQVLASKFLNQKRQMMLIRNELLKHGLLESGERWEKVENREIVI